MIVFQLIQKPQLRGAEMFAAQLSHHLEDLGHKVYVVSLFGGNSELPFSGEKIRMNRPINKRWNDYKGWKELAFLIDKYKPEVIQCNAGDTLKYAVLSKKIFKWKQPIIARNASMVSLYIKNPVTKWINKQLYKNATSIISVSTNSMNDIISLYPEVATKTEVIPVGIEIKKINQVEWLRSKEAQKHIIHVGGFSFEKNHVALLRIFNTLLKKHPNIHLHLLGEGPLKQNIEQLALELGIEAHISFYGWVSNPMDYICKADLLVLPSIIEGLPGVLLEAMINNTVVVANNVGGIPEIIDHRKTGYLVQKNNEEAFVEAMENGLFLDNEKIIQSAFELVKNKYNNITIAKQFVESYYKISK